MYSKFISLIVGAAMAITSFSAPASAGDRDVARAVAAIAGIALIGAAINQSSKRNDNYVASRGYGNNRYYAHPPQRPYQNVHRHGQQRRQAIAARSYRQGYNDHRAQTRHHRTQHQHHRAQKQYHRAQKQYHRAQKQYRQSQKRHARRGYANGH
jgi:hypothetical protein